MLPGRGIVKEAGRLRADGGARQPLGGPDECPDPDPWPMCSQEDRALFTDRASPSFLANDSRTSSAVYPAWKRRQQVCTVPRSPPQALRSLRPGSGVDPEPCQSTADVAPGQAEFEAFGEKQVLRLHPLYLFLH